MGWKAIKEHYRIEHIVEARDGRVIVRSDFVPHLLSIYPDGAITLNDLYADTKEMIRIKSEMDADPALMQRLFAQEDHFERSITVYTYKRSEILEKQCEEFGWPNVTHDGVLMHDNDFSVDRNVIVEKVRRSMKADVEWARKEILAAEKKLQDSRDVLTDFESALVDFESVHGPSPVAVAANSLRPG